MGTKREWEHRYRTRESKAHKSLQFIFREDRDRGLNERKLWFIGRE